MNVTRVGRVTLTTGCAGGTSDLVQVCITCRLTCSNHAKKGMKRRGFRARVSSQRYPRKFLIHESTTARRSRSGFAIPPIRMR
jgi:hypothetical protein